MVSGQQLKEALVTLQVSEDFTEAVIRLDDGSRLCLCHRVGQRWAKSVGPEADLEQAGRADELLAAIRMFRLNAKHLEIHFTDGSHWEAGWDDDTIVSQK